MTKFERLCAMIAAVLLLALAGAPAAFAQSADNGVNAATFNATAPDLAMNSTTTTTTNTVSTNTTGGPSEASQTIDPKVYGEMFRILFAVFTIAVVLESALAVIFNWRLFLVYFDSRGAKTVISVVAGIVVAASLGLDVIDRLYKAMFSTGSAGLGVFGYAVTGLVLAGGSAGVNNILKALGFRSVRSEDEKEPKPRKTEAWLAVRLKRALSEKRPVQVFLTRDNEGERLIGTITGTKSPSFLPLLRTNPLRFPPVAGFPVPADSLVTVELRDPSLPTEQSGTEAIWGPYRVSGGAIIDFELTL